MSKLSAVLAVSLLVSGCMSFHRGPMPGEPKNATFAVVQDTRVRYADTGGPGPAIVLLHGFASALDTWTTVVPQLSPSYRVISLDLKGFGWTDRPPGDYSPHAQARMVFGLLDQLAVDKAAVVAHSWGSSIALAMALQAPNRVTKIALYDAWVYEEQLPSMFLWGRTQGVGELLFGLFYKERSDEKMTLAFYDKSLVTEPFVEEVNHALDRPGTVAAALAAVRGQTYDRWQHRYKTIRQPVLLLWGREDVVTPLTVGERLVGDLPRARLIVYPRCGHFPMIEAVSASNADLVRFLGENPG